MAAIVFPSNPAGQTPVNTFSPTSTPQTNTVNSYTYVWNGSVWTSDGLANQGVLSWSGGTTGFLPSTPTSGNVLLSGVLSISNGGTGQSTPSGSLNNLLPTQVGAAGLYLSTNGTNAFWTTAGSSGTPTVNTYTSSGTYVAPVTGSVLVTVIGAGGGGIGDDTTGASYWGGGGGAGWGNVNVVAGTSYPFTIGTGGYGGLNAPLGKAGPGGGSSGFGIVVNGGEGAGFKAGDCRNARPDCSTNGYGAPAGSGGSIGNLGGGTPSSPYPTQFISPGYGQGAIVDQVNNSYQSPGNGAVVIISYLV